MTTVQEIFKDIEDTFDIHDHVRKYFESKKALWLESEQNKIVSAYSNPLALSIVFILCRGKSGCSNKLAV